MFARVQGLTKEDWRFLVAEPTKSTLMDLISGPVDQTSSPQEKIALFRSLFRGREDVYPRRFESRKTGRSGYAPACANEWIRGVCEKLRIKCTECPNRRFLPVTDDVIRWHLSGCDAEGQPFVAGVYPLLQDETCFFLAVDFDKAGWRDDAAAFLEACRHLNLPAALERSRSGRGGHVWFFFEEAIPAALARRLGSHVLTETMEGRPDIGLDSYDRLFPNQDTMPQGGFGNLITLPLQRAPRKQDNTVFLDNAFVPWADQWAFLASVRKIGRPQVEEIVEDAERRGRILGVRLPPQDDGETEPGLRLRHVDERPRSSVICQRHWNSSLGIRSTSPSKGCIRDFETDCFDSLRSRIPSSTKRRRCGFRHTASHASSRASRIFRITSDCRGAASMTFARRSPTLAFAWPFATSAATVLGWR